MLSRRLQLIATILFAVSGATMVFATPVFACHKPTGWCCVGGGHTGNNGEFCCYFENDVIQVETCG